MKNIWMVMVAYAALLARPVVGQANVQALETAIHGKPLALLTYSADQVARYTWTDGKLLPAYVELHGVKAFFPDTVQKKGSKIVIEGQTSTLVKNAGKLAVMGKTPMRLEIDLEGADAAAVVPQLQAALFFPTMSAALAALPPSVADILPFPSDGVYHQAQNSHVFEDGKWITLENDATLKPPMLTKKADDPGLDQKGVDAKVSGSISLIYYISPTGRVDEVWVAKPLGSGLDEAAARQGRANIFNPATHGGKPVGSVIVQTLGVNLGPATP
jgi:Gram-negative bacterial TonB protein C-terminal